MHRLPLRHPVDAQLGDPMTDPLRHLDRFVEAGVGQQHQKLLATVAPHPIEGAQLGGDAAGHLGQHLVPHVVAQGIVDLLEVIDVKLQHRQGPAMLSCLLEPGLPLGLDLAAVVQPGQVVGHGEPAHLAGAVELMQRQHAHHQQQQNDHRILPVAPLLQLLELGLLQQLFGLEGLVLQLFTGQVELKAHLQRALLPEHPLQRVLGLDVLFEAGQRPVDLALLLQDPGPHLIDPRQEALVLLLDEDGLGLGQVVERLGRVALRRLRHSHHQLPVAQGHAV